MESQILSSNAALIFAMGMVSYIGLLHLWLWQRNDRAHLWVAIWCAFTLVFQGARHVQLHTDDVGTAVQAAHVLGATAPLLIWSLVAFARTVNRGDAGARYVSLGLFAASAFAAVIYATPWVLGYETGTRVDWFGRPHVSVPAGPAMPVLSLCIMAGLSTLVAEIVLARSLTRRERLAMVGSVAVYGVFGILSALSAAKIISMPMTADYGPLVVAVGLSYQLVQRHHRLQSRLAEEVDERTHEIESARQRLAESEARYRGLVDNAPVGVLACDREGRLQAVNPQLLALLGSPSEEQTREINMLTFPPLVESGVAGTMRACIEEDRVTTGEHVYTSRWGRTLDVRLKVAPLRDAQGQVDGALCIAEEMSERKALEARVRQSQKMESVAQLAAGLAHEINNPMAYVRTNLSLLRGEWDELRSLLEKSESSEAGGGDLAHWEELIDESLDGVDRTIAIVRDMKDFSRAADETREPSNVNALVESSLRFASPHRPPGVRVMKALADLPLIPASPGQLRQVFLNLIMNAFQASPENGIVRVETRDAGDYVVVTIHDVGCGIPEEHLERLFDPFFTTKGTGEGTGLGLYVSYEIVRLHHGDIHVESAPTRGTTFEVHLPKTDQS